MLGARGRGEGQREGRGGRRIKEGERKGRGGCGRKSGGKRCCMGNAEYKCLVVVFLLSGLQDH